LSQTFPGFPVGLQLWPEKDQGCAAPLKEGYSFSLLESSSDTYHFSVLTGIERVRQIFSNFIADMPEDEAFFILEFYVTEPSSSDQEPPNPTIHYSPYMSTQEILSCLEPYWDRLLHDGFVGFGLANNRSGQEMFYSEEKILTFFTDNHLRLTNQLFRVGLHHDPDQELHTDMGHDHLSLLCLDRGDLPVSLQDFNDRELDYVRFCQDLVDTLGMYPVEETLSFFFSRKEQQAIEALLKHHPDYAEFAEDDFGALLLDWNDFVQECCDNFEGDLWEYRMGLKLRDTIQFVIANCVEPLRSRILETITEPDERFRQTLGHNRKRLDNPGTAAPAEHFWYNGVISNAGVDLRRDLIRHGWYK